MTRRNPRAAAPIAPHSGFSLVEVMVALIVMSVGLLGIAKMQALALASTTTSKMRSLAALEAASLASTMRADRAYWSAVAADPIVVINAGVVTSTTDGPLKATTPDCESDTTVCTTSRIAAKDLQAWAVDLSNQVPNETARINCKPGTPATPTTCTITIQWLEKQVASNAQQELAAATPTLTTYTLYVAP
jgi:type IV pilus assembly protein PilV